MGHDGAATNWAEVDEGTTASPYYPDFVFKPRSISDPQKRRVVYVIAKVKERRGLRGVFGFKAEGRAHFEEQRPDKLNGILGVPGNVGVGNIVAYVKITKCSTQKYIKNIC